MTEAYDRRDDPRMTARAFIAIASLAGLNLGLVYLLLFTGAKPWPY